MIVLLWRGLNFVVRISVGVSLWWFVVFSGEVVESGVLV